jgi:hypothetical protein
MTICIVGVVDGEDGLPLKVENLPRSRVKGCKRRRG